MEDRDIKINGEKVTAEKLQEVKQDLKQSERLVEVKEGEYRKLNRLKG